MAKCKSCGADIIFIKTANGKAMPCDAQDALYRATKGGKYIYITKDGETRRGEPVQPEDAQDATGVGYVPHWATCPHAAKFRGGKR